MWILHKGVWRIEFFNFTVGEDEDFVTIDDSVQSMGDCDDSRVLQVGFQQLLNSLFCYNIDV